MGRHLTAEDRNYWVIDWLSRQGPAEWHGLAMAWDWEDGVEPLHWIIEQPTCDRATALAIFWESDPEYFLSEDGIETPIGEMDEDIVARWKAGQYSSSLFSYDPTEKADLPEESPVNDVITIDMGMPVSGSERAPNYSYGLPEEIEAAWNESNGVVERAIWSPEDEDELDEIGAEETWSAPPAPSFTGLEFASLDNDTTPDFSVPDFAANASAAIGASHPQVPPEMQPSAFRPTDSETEFSETQEAQAEQEIAYYDNEIAPQIDAEPETISDIEEQPAEWAVSDEIVEHPPVQTTANLPEALFDEGEDEAVAEAVQAPPSLAAYSWKSKPIEVTETAIEPVPQMPEAIEAETEVAPEVAVHTSETALDPVEQPAIDMTDSPVDMAYSIPSLPQYDDSDEEEDDLPPYQPLSYAAIDYDAVDAAPHDDPVFVEAEEFSAEEAEVIETAEVSEEGDNAQDDGEQDDGDAYDVTYQAAAYDTNHYAEPVADTPTGDVLVHDEVTPVVAVETRPVINTDDEDEEDEGDEASFAYDLKSMFAPPAPATGPGKFGTAVRVPPEPAPYVPTEQDLAARVAAVEAEAQVSSRIRSLRQSSIEEAQQAETSGGLMGKMRSMLGR